MSKNPISSPRMSSQPSNATRLSLVRFYHIFLCVQPSLRRSPPCLCLPLRTNSTDNARYLLIRLLLRTPRIHRQIHLAESYAGEIGKQNIAATMDELCLRFDGSKQPVDAPSGKGKEKEKIVIDLTEDEEQDDPELARALRESLKSFNNSSSSSVGVNGKKGKENGVGAGAGTKGKGKEVAGGGAGKKLPQAVVDALDMDERPLDLSHFCGAASSGDVGEEKLLRCLKMNELKEVAKAMKVWKNGLTVSSTSSSVLVSALRPSLLSRSQERLELTI